MGARAAVSMALANIVISAGMTVAALFSLVLAGQDMRAMLAISSAGAYAALIASVWLLAPKSRRAECLGL